MTRSKYPLATFLAVVLLAALGMRDSAATSGSSGNANLLLGLKLLEDSIGDQNAVALDLTWGLQAWPVLLNVYSSGSWRDGQNSVSGDVSEAGYEGGVGLTRVWKTGIFRPHIGAGVGRIWRRTHIHEGLNSDEREFMQAGTRVWVAGGGFWRIGSGLNLGAAVRFSELGPHDVRLGGTHVGWTVGWGWGD